MAHTSSGWYEAADHTGKAPRHKAASTKKRLSTTARTAMRRNKEQDIISAAIKFLINEYQVEYGVSVDDINQGECMDFAEKVYDMLLTEGIKGEVLSDGLFFDLFGEEPAEMMLDTDQYGKTPNNFGNVGLPSHYWYYYKGRHYDSKTPEGVDDMFELPLIKKWYLKKQKIRGKP